MLVCGEVKCEEGRESVIFGNELYALADAPGIFAKNLRIHCRVDNDVPSSQKMEKLRAILSDHPGGYPISLTLDLPGNRSATIEPDPTWAVNPTAECIAALEALWGHNAITYTLRNHDIFGDPKRNRRARFVPHNA